MRRKGEEAKERPSHIGRAILSRIACFTDNLSQHITHIKSSDVEQLVVSGWCKFEHWFPNTVSAIVNAEDSCSYIKGWNNEISMGIPVGEKILVTMEPKLPKMVQNVTRFSGPLVIWIGEPT